MGVLHLIPHNSLAKFSGGIKVSSGTSCLSLFKNFKRPEEYFETTVCGGNLVEEDEFYFPILLELLLSFELKILTI